MVTVKQFFKIQLHAMCWSWWGSAELILNKFVSLNIILKFEIVHQSPNEPLHQPPLVESLNEMFEDKKVYHALNGQETHPILIRLKFYEVLKTDWSLNPDNHGFKTSKY